jgi:cob(I)alamin adenosyltransferase
MPDRLTKIYTGKGDQGYTMLRKERLSKDDLLVEALGTVDELNSAIGLALSFHSENKDLENKLTKIQNELFNLGGELHFPEHIVITAEKTSQLEEMLDEWNNTLPPLKEFLLPRGNPSSAACHLARTICRRAERCMVRLHRQLPLPNPEMLRYLNRLSDVLFVAARILMRDTKEEEKMWDHKKFVPEKNKKT